MNDSELCEFVWPEWSAPTAVRAVCTTRKGGFSRDAWQGLNLADHVGDAPEHVSKNRELLTQTLGLPSEPIWLKQVHGCEVIQAGSDIQDIACDASISFQAGVVCAVLTADCLPVLLCSRQGDRVAAIHAGWRGLAAGVIEQTAKKLDCRGSDLIAWLGPAIGPQVFEVGEEVRRVFVSEDKDAQSAFKFLSGGKRLCNIYKLAKLRLNRLGVKEITGGDFCTFTYSERFYSYRRDGVTGRMASLIWIE